MFQISQMKSSINTLLSEIYSLASNINKIGNTLQNKYLLTFKEISYVRKSSNNHDIDSKRDKKLRHSLDVFFEEASRNDKVLRKEKALWGVQPFLGTRKIW